MKVVLDSNVLVSAILFKGKMAVFYTLIVTGAITPCFTRATFSELRRVFYYKKFQKKLEALGMNVEEILEAIRETSDIYPQPRKRTQLISDDPDDDHIVDAAIASGAPFIVTGDPHLKKVESHKDILVVSPREFLDAFFR